MPDYNDIWELVSAVFCRNTQVEPPKSLVHNDSESSGVAFEQRVRDELQHIAFKYHGVLFSNLYAHYGKSEELAQIDHVLLLSDRLVIVECKDYQGTIDCISVVSKDGKPYWTQRTERDELFYFYSPVIQNQAHIRAVSDAVAVSFNKCFSLIIFSNRSQLSHVPDITSALAVINLKDLGELNFEPVPSRVFSTIKYNGILRKLEGCLTVTKEDLQRHQTYVKARVSPGLSRATPSVCPRCGSVLVLRHSHTKFLGCSMYPLCDYTFTLED